MTPDIVKLRDSLPTLEAIIERLELELVDDPSWGEPSDTSYLTDADRQNPDIAANVEAMAETNRLIAWFGRDAEGYLGLWRGPQNRPLTEAPVVRLDSEGQYSIVAASVPEYLAIAMPEDEFASTRDALTAAGFKVGFNPDAIWGALDAFDDDPNAYRAELYERARVARGLPRSDADEGDEDDGFADGDDGADTDGVPEPAAFAAGSQAAVPITGTSRNDELDDEEAEASSGDGAYANGDGEDEDEESEDENRASGDRGYAATDRDSAAGAEDDEEDFAASDDRNYASSDEDEDEDDDEDDDFDDELIDLDDEYDELDEDDDKPTRPGRYDE